MFERGLQEDQKLSSREVRLQGSQYMFECDIFLIFFKGAIYKDSRYPIEESLNRGV